MDVRIRAASNETKLISKADKVFHALFALCVLAPFNFIILFGPFFIISVAVVSLWVLAISGLLTSVLVLLISFFTVAISFPLFF